MSRDYYILTFDRAYIGTVVKGPRSPMANLQSPIILLLLLLLFLLSSLSLSLLLLLLLYGKTTATEVTSVSIIF